MTLNQIIKPLSVIERKGKANPEISGVAHDSRHVKAGELFCCFLGLQADGHFHAAEAAANGAAAILCERFLDIDIPQIKVANARAAMALCCGQFFGNPASGMTMIAVTGTNGKTTVTHLIKSIAEAYGKRVGLIGTCYTMIDRQTLPANATTPDPFALHGLLRKMADEGINWVIMEASAHALWLHKLAGINFNVGVFTNISQDHLNDFGTMEHYFEVKKSLFDLCKQGVVGIDQPELLSFARSVKNIPILEFGLNEAALTARNLEQTSQGVAMRMERNQTGIDLTLPIPGIFSVQNALAAAGAALCLEIPWAVIRVGLMQTPQVPGRLEMVPGGPAAYIIDYAHTPDALSNMLTCVRGFTTGRLIVVFGCGGQRDAQKRPIMGQVAAGIADLLCITSDNPRNENPESIMDAIEAGIPSDKPLVRYADRAAAIAWAVDMAQAGDTVVIAGKGHEETQEINGVFYPFSDRQILEQCIHRV